MLLLTLAGLVSDAIIYGGQYRRTISYKASTRWLVRSNARDDMKGGFDGQVSRSTNAISTDRRNESR